MKKKTLLIALVLGAIMVAGAFASPVSEGDPTSEWETITVTGVVSFKDWPNPEITSRGTTYELMVPRFAMLDIDIEAGDEVTIEGILVDQRVEDEEPMLMVTKALIDGEEYEVPFAGGMGHSDGRGRMGPERGNMGRARRR